MFTAAFVVIVAVIEREKNAQKVYVNTFQYKSDN
jgi:hypothetical protein